MTQIETRRCKWCGRRFAAPVGVQGRPRLYCRRSCRQREYESKRRADELGLAEGELVVARRQIDDLGDRLFVLEAAIDDVERDLGEDSSIEAHREALAWLLDAARPLVAWRLGLETTQ